MNNLCEWKEELEDGSPEKYVKTGLVFYPCEKMSFRVTNVRMFSGLCEKVISHGEELFDFCPYCGADIRKPESKEITVMTKEISKGLTLKKGKDGHWLHFESHGVHGGLNLENLMEGKRIIRTAVLGWASNQFENNIELGKLLIMKSGDTVVIERAGKNYLCVWPHSEWRLKDYLLHFENNRYDVLRYKPFSEITLDDSIANLRPMVMVSDIDNPELGKLWGMDIKECIIETCKRPAIWVNRICVRLATAKELQEAE